MTKKHFSIASERCRRLDVDPLRCVVHGGYGETPRSRRFVLTSLPCSVSHDTRCALTAECTFDVPSSLYPAR